MIILACRHISTLSGHIVIEFDTAQLSLLLLLPLANMLEKVFKSGQNLHELLQSDILNRGRDIDHLSLLVTGATRHVKIFVNDGGVRVSIPNWGRAYHGNATKHREETDVEGTHVSAEVCYHIVRGNTYDM
jgi:hypothetical protein